MVPVAHHAGRGAHRADPAALVVHRAAPAVHHEDRAQHRVAPAVQRVVLVAHHAGQVVHHAAPAAPDRLAAGQVAVAGSLLAHHGAARDPCPAARSRIASMA